MASLNISISKLKYFIHKIGNVATFFHSNSIGVEYLFRIDISICYIQQTTQTEYSNFSGRGIFHFEYTNFSVRQCKAPVHQAYLLLVKPCNFFHYNHNIQVSYSKLFSFLFLLHLIIVFIFVFAALK